MRWIDLDRESWWCASVCGFVMFISLNHEENVYDMNDYIFLYFTFILFGTFFKIFIPRHVLFIKFELFS